MRKRPNAQGIYPTEGIQNYRNVECNWWELYRTDAPVKNYVGAKFHYKRPLSEEQLLQGIINGRIFGYVQCDIEVREQLLDYFSNFPSIFKNTVVSRNDIGDLMKEYAEKEGIMPQPRSMHISSFILTNGIIITPLLLFYSKLGPVCKKIHRFVHYTPRKCSETMKLLANSFYGHQMMDRSRHTVAECLTDEKTHSAKNSKMFKRLNHITDHLFEVEIVKSETEHREPILVGFFILIYAKLRMLELHYNYFKNFCDIDNYYYLYLASSEENLEDVFPPKKRAEWDQLRAKDCTDNMSANATDSFFPELAVMSTRNMIRESQVSVKKI